MDSKGGPALSGTEAVWEKSMNCSIVTAVLPIERSARDEAIAQEPRIESHGPCRVRAVRCAGGNSKRKQAQALAALPLRT